MVARAAADLRFSAGADPSRVERGADPFGRSAPSLCPSGPGASGARSRPRAVGARGGREHRGGAGAAACSVAGRSERPAGDRSRLCRENPGHGSARGADGQAAALVAAALREAVCTSCGTTYTRSVNTAKSARRFGRPAVCRPCRYPTAAAGNEERLRRWWLEESGFTLDELQEIGRLIWPELRPALTVAA